MNQSMGLLLVLLLWGALAGSESYGPEVGMEAPDFVLEDSKGNPFRLSDFRGKKLVVLEFFRSGSW